jgi:hypothetical protein
MDVGATVDTSVFREGDRLNGRAAGEREGSQGRAMQSEARGRLGF